MLSEVQSRKIIKYRKLARKNVFFRYLATILIVFNIICTKFLTFHKRRITVLAQLCLVVVVFFFSTSFAPPAFPTEPLPIEASNMYEQVQTGDADYTEDISESEFLEELHDEHDLVDTEEDTANLEDLMENNKTALVPLITQESAAKTDGAVFSKDDWRLLLINKQHRIPEDYQVTLGTIKGSMRCDERIIEPLTQMFAAAKEDGVNLIVCSPYRDMARQEYLFERKVKNYIKTGMSYMDAYKQASITVTVPGASEHQIGLAVDIISDTYTSLNEGFADTPAGQWLNEHSWEYGFILRYPDGKEEITGIGYEPWHFRYVGVEAAELMTKDGITLEEFVENL